MLPANIIFYYSGAGKLALLASWIFFLAYKIVSDYKKFTSTLKPFIFLTKQLNSSGSSIIFDLNYIYEGLAGFRYIWRVESESIP